MASDRFHKAAKDGILEILKEATRNDCNSRDEDGMTPTLWAAFEGNLEALRLLVGRGGDPDKADHFGNTALHFAAARGHTSCVTFLINFGANLWALDIDFHTPKELAAMNSRDDILRFLDGVAAKEEASNKKKTKMMREKAQKDAEKRNKNYEKMKQKAEKLAEKEQMRLRKEREKMLNRPEEVAIMPHRPSNVLTILKLKGRKNTGFSNTNGNPSPRFSEIVSGGGAGTLIGAGKRTGVTGVQKKLQQKMNKAHQPATNNQQGAGDFKIGQVEMDGKRSLRSLTGLRRDSEVLYAGSYDTQAGGRQRGKLGDVFDTQGELSRSTSEPDFLHNADSGFGDDVLLQEPASIFDRPGFGSVAFRNSISATLSALPRTDDKESTVTSNSEKGGGGSGTEDCSIGSAGSLAKRNQRNTEGLPWDDEDVESDEDDESRSPPQWSPLQLFLMSAGLSEFVSCFVSEQIDLQALMLLTEDDLKTLGLGMGPRKKLLKAIEDRKAALEDPGEVSDSRL
ncbi:pre-mRNA splicing regulator USH1G [Periplaneta americana]|uniref:pre-mRNA splicing regulator USH1G n=1 Tax=Periplaneta americana TaxID=6978 RepID=UPI0037E94370